MEIAGQVFAIQPGEDKGFEVNGKQYDTWADVEQAMVDQYVQNNPSRTTKEARIALKFDATPEISSVSQLSADQIQKLKANQLQTKEDI